MATLDGLIQRVQSVVPDTEASAAAKGVLEKALEALVEEKVSLYPGDLDHLLTIYK